MSTETEPLSIKDELQSITELAVKLRQAGRAVIILSDGRRMVRHVEKIKDGDDAAYVALEQQGYNLFSPTHGVPPNPTDHAIVRAEIAARVDRQMADSATDANQLAA